MSEMLFLYRQVVDGISFTLLSSPLYSSSHQRAYKGLLHSTPPSSKTYSSSNLSYRKYRCSSHYPRTVSDSI